MTWEEIRSVHLHEWVIVEAIRETRDPHIPGRVLVKLGPPRVANLTLVRHFQDPRGAMQEFCRLCSLDKTRELYVVPTDLQKLVLDPPSGLRIP